MNIENILEQASKLRIAVVGDYITDRYLIGEVNRISPEAPVQVLDLKETRENPGGAGNVTANLRGLGVQVSEFYGKHKPIKTRVMAGNHHIIRIDDETEPYWMKWDEVEIGLGYGIMYDKFDAVVISDYGKGMVSTEVARQIIHQCYGRPNQIPVIVDAKRDFDKFGTASIIKCNNMEATQIEVGNFRNFATRFDVEHFVVTDGGNGISAVNQYDQIIDAEGFHINICDTCGAGDTVTAVLAMMKCLWRKGIVTGIKPAIELANIAASEVCRHPGVKPINKELLIKRFNEVYGS